MQPVNVIGPSHPLFDPAATSDHVRVPKFVVPQAASAVSVPFASPRSATTPPSSEFFSKQLDAAENTLAGVVSFVDRIAEKGLNTLDRILGINHEYSDAVENPHIRRAALLGGGSAIALDQYKKSKGKGQPDQASARGGSGYSVGGRNF